MRRSGASVRAAFRRCSRTVCSSACSALVALALVSCAASPAGSASSPTATNAGAHQVRFTNISAVSNSRQDGGATLIVGTSDQKTELIRSLVPSITPPDAGTMYVAAFQGSQRTGGYAITITSIERSGDQLIVRASFVEPAPGAVVTEVLTSPAHVVTIAASDLAGAKTAVLLDGTGAERGRVALS